MRIKKKDPQGNAGGLRRSWRGRMRDKARERQINERIENDKGGHGERWKDTYLARGLNRIYRERARARGRKGKWIQYENRGKRREKTIILIHSNVGRLRWRIRAHRGTKERTASGEGKEGRSKISPQEEGRRGRGTEGGCGAGLRRTPRAFPEEERTV